MEVRKPAPSAERVVIQDGHFFLNGERFIVRGVGYEPGARPGQYPWLRKFEPEVLHFDLERIQNAGFNTLRCWSGYTDEELTVMEEAGLWVIQGIWVPQDGQFDNPAFIRDALKHVEEVVRVSRKHKNILMYVVMNEPLAENILRSGEENFVQLLHTLQDRIHTLDPGVPVTFANTITGDFIDISSLDVAAFNLYIYSTSTIQSVLGYRGYVEWLKKERAPHQPLVITEFGLSVSHSGEGAMGYGGNSLKEQAEGDLWMLDSLLQGGADGSCAFQYADGWWKGGKTPNSADTHDDEPEEWFGLIGIDSKEHPEGSPRPAYYAFQKENAALWIQPVSWKEYPDILPLEVYATDDITAVEAQTESGQIVHLKQDKSWWRGMIPADSLKPLEKIQLSVQSKKFGEIKKERSIVTRWHELPEELQPLEFTLEDFSPVPMKDSVRVIRVTSRDGMPIANRSFTVGVHVHHGWDHGEARKVVSDPLGRVEVKLGPFAQAGILTLSISTGSTPLKDEPVWGNAFVLHCNNGPAASVTPPP